MSVIKYSFKDEKRVNEKLVRGSNGFEIRSKDVNRIAPGNHILVKTGIVLEPISGIKLLVSIDSEKAQKSGLIVLNPIGITNFSGTDELEILIHNISARTAIINFNDIIATLSGLILERLVEDNYPDELSDKGVQKDDFEILKDTKITNSEPEIKKVKDKKTTKKIKLEELVVNEKI